MKTMYYLIPQTLMVKQAGLKRGQFPAEKVTKVFGSALEARLAAKARERELNGGNEYSTAEAVKVIDDPNAAALWFVTPEPQSTARSYRSFPDWPCNQEQEGGAA